MRANSRSQNGILRKQVAWLRSASRVKNHHLDLCFGLWYSFTVTVKLPF